MLTAEEIRDVRRGLIIAIKTLDETKNRNDILLATRLEMIEKKLSEIKNTQ